MANVKNSLDQIQIYVGTYRKYNEGSLFGKWLKLADYSDFNDLQNAMREIHIDEKDPEFMVQDREISPLFENMGLVSESYISSKIYDVLEKVKDFELEWEVVESFVDCFGVFSDIDDLLEKVSENYNGEFSSDEDFAESLLTETGAIPQNLPSYIYIDWERTARDIMYDYSTNNGHYFRNF